LLPTEVAAIFTDSALLVLDGDDEDYTVLEPTGLEYRLIRVEAALAHFAKSHLDGQEPPEDGRDWLRVLLVPQLDSASLSQIDREPVLEALVAALEAVDFQTEPLHLFPGQTEVQSFWEMVLSQFGLSFSVTEKALLSERLVSHVTNVLRSLPGEKWDIFTHFGGLEFLDVIVRLRFSSEETTEQVADRPRLVFRFRGTEIS